MKLVNIEPNFILFSYYTETKYPSKDMSNSEKKRAREKKINYSFSFHFLVKYLKEKFD